jgi:hypothetical protein
MARSPKRIRRKPAQRGGRKPKSNVSRKAATFSIRIAAETRAALEAESRAAGQSMSQVAERLIRLGLKTEQDRRRDNPMHALCYLIAETGRVIGGFHGPDGRPKFDWRTNHFMFRAFKLAVGHLLDALEPESGMDQDSEQFDQIAFRELPPMTLESYNSPEARARNAAMIIWQALQTAEPVPQQETDGARPRREERGEIIEAQRYGMSHARRDLNINTAETAKPISSFPISGC